MENWAQSIMPDVSDICIVSSGCLSSGPRVVKEADALCDAGYSVKILVVHTLEWMGPWDAELARGKSWTYEALRWDWRSPGVVATRLLGGVLARLARAMKILPVFSISPVYYPLLRKARQSHARLYIAHNLAALPIAARAAEYRGAHYAFDAEDDHLAQLSPAERESSRGRSIYELELQFLPGASYVTAASEGIASQLANRYGIPMPHAVYNVFPLKAATTTDGKFKDRRSEALSLYWFSQTIGLDRGLEDLFRAAGQLKGEFQIHLRGSMTVPVRQALTHMAEEQGILAKLHFHAQVHPNELMSRTSEHDIGMALESQAALNYQITVTNKIFAYFTCGLAVAATDVVGQKRVLDTCPEAGFTYPPGNFKLLAERLQVFLDDPGLLKRAKLAARSAAQTRWSWELESQKLVSVVSSVLSPGKRSQEMLPRRNSAT